MKNFPTILLIVFLLTCTDAIGQGTYFINEHGEEELVPWRNQDLSMVKLLCNPEPYNGKIIGVSGYLNLEFEGNAIYLHKDDADYNIFQNGFWVSFSDCIDPRELSGYSGKYVRIVGRLTVEDGGHLGLWSGEIKNILEIRMKRRSE